MNRSPNNLNQISNVDLKQRLIQFGFPNVPITATTKPILLKQLQNCLNKEKAKLGEATKYLAQYSSDEESDDIAKQGTEKNVSRFSNFIFKRPIKSFNRSMPTPQNLDLLSRRTTSSFQSASTSKLNNFTPQQNPNIRDSPTECKYDRFTSNTALSQIYNDTNDQNISDKSITDKDLNSSLHAKYDLVGGHSNLSNHRSNYSSSCVSDFTRRLLNLRSETLKNDYTRSELHHKKRMITLNNNKKNAGNRQELTSSVKKTIDAHISPSTAFSNLLNKLDEQYGSKQTIIPYVLIGLLSVFLSLLALMYLTITPDLANTLSEKNTRFNYCDNELSEPLHLSSLTCIDIGHLDSALEMIKLIIPILQHRAEEHNCVSSSKPFTVSTSEALNLMHNKGKSNSMRETIKDLQNVEYLIEKNPQWNVKHVDFNGKVLNFEDVVEMRNKQGIYFAILNPQLPLSCSIYNKVQKLFCIVGVVGIFVLAVGLIYAGYNIIIIYYKSKRDIINYFIEEIMNVVIKTAYDTNQNSVYVNHLRDKLIPLHKRKKLDWAWEQAIKYLQENESRLQFEMKIINGEDCKIIKWIDTLPTEHYPQTSTSKKWQSPAFDNSNKIINPPTSCLKIRQMFDKFEACDPNLKTVIKDAILEKVGRKCKIYDIQLDKQTCCVYVRCASEQDAGIVHNEINGWWFDKRLVSIKFLRVERYLNRFVDSSTGPAYLSPSNAKNLSMTQCAKNVQEDDIIDS